MVIVVLGSGERANFTLRPWKRFRVPLADRLPVPIPHTEELESYRCQNAKKPLPGKPHYLSQPFPWDAPSTGPGARRLDILDTKIP